MKPVPIEAERRRPVEAEGVLAQPYPVHIPDGEYLAFCKRSYSDKTSRTYGEKVYLRFKIFSGEHAGKELRMFLRPSPYHTSNYYRAWSIAHGGPPRSRNTRMNHKIFEGKLFRVRVATVKPRHYFTGPDGKRRQGDLLPESFWYSKVDCLLSLEVTNSLVEIAPQQNGAIPFPVTKISDKSS